jgi:hypothetical protein
MIDGNRKGAKRHAICSSLVLMGEAVGQEIQALLQFLVAEKFSD